jgi:hypothetical protein
MQEESNSALLEVKDGIVILKEDLTNLNIVKSILLNQESTELVTGSIDALHQVINWIDSKCG